MRITALLFALVAASPAAAASKNIFSADFYKLSNTDFIVLIAFLVFIGVLFYFKVPAMITGMLDKRAEGIQAELDEARALREEAQTLLAQIGRMPESRMLLMAGLLLADKAAGSEDRVRAMESQVGALRAELEEAREAAMTPNTVEVARIPPEVTDTLAELAARAEAMAESIEEQAGAA